MFISSRTAVSSSNILPAKLHPPASTDDEMRSSSARLGEGVEVNQSGRTLKLVFLRSNRSELEVGIPCGLVVKQLLVLLESRGVIQDATRTKLLSGGMKAHHLLYTLDPDQRIPRGTVYVVETPSWTSQSQVVPPRQNMIEAPTQDPSLSTRADLKAKSCASLSSGSKLNHNPKTINEAMPKQSKEVHTEQLNSHTTIVERKISESNNPGPPTGADSPCNVVVHSAGRNFSDRSERRSSLSDIGDERSELSRNHLNFLQRSALASRSLSSKKTPRHRIRLNAISKAFAATFNDAPRALSVQLLSSGLELEVLVPQKLSVACLLQVLLERGIITEVGGVTFFRSMPGMDKNTSLVQMYDHEHICAEDSCVAVLQGTCTGRLPQPAQESLQAPRPSESYCLLASRFDKLRAAVHAAKSLPDRHEPEQLDIRTTSRQNTISHENEGAVHQEKIAETCKDDNEVQGVVENRPLCHKQIQPTEKRMNCEPDKVHVGLELIANTTQSPNDTSNTSLLDFAVLDRKERAFNEGRFVVGNIARNTNSLNDTSTLDCPQCPVLDDNKRGPNEVKVQLESSLGTINSLNDTSFFDFAILDCKERDNNPEQFAVENSAENFNSLRGMAALDSKQLKPDDDKSQEIVEGCAETKNSFNDPTTAQFISDGLFWDDLLRLIEHPSIFDVKVTNYREPDEEKVEEKEPEEEPLDELRDSFTAVLQQRIDSWGTWAHQKWTTGLSECMESVCVSIPSEGLSKVSQCSSSTSLGVNDRSDWHPSLRDESLCLLHKAGQLRTEIVVLYRRSAERDMQFRECLRRLISDLVELCQWAAAGCLSEEHVHELLRMHPEATQSLHADGCHLGCHLNSGDQLLDPSPLASKQFCATQHAAAVTVQTPFAKEVDMRLNGERLREEVSQLSIDLQVAQHAVEVRKRHLHAWANSMVSDLLEICQCAAQGVLTEEDKWHLHELERLSSIASVGISAHINR